MSRTHKVTGNHVKFALCVVVKQKHVMYNKTIIRFGFCDIQNNQGFGKSYQPQPLTSADNLYLDLVYPGQHKNFIQYFFILSCCMVAMSHDVIFVVVERTCPLSVPLAMLTMKKSCMG